MRRRVRVVRPKAAGAASAEADGDSARAAGAWSQLNQYTDRLVGDVKDNIFGVGTDQVEQAAAEAQAQGILRKKKQQGGGVPVEEALAATGGVPAWKSYPALGRTRKARALQAVRRKAGLSPPASPQEAPAAAPPVQQAVGKKRRAGADPRSLKDLKQQLGVRRVEVVPSPSPEDLWAADAPAYARPANKTHGAHKAARMARQDAKRRVQLLPDEAQSYNPDAARHSAAVEAAARTLLAKEAKEKRAIDRMRVNPEVRRTVVGDDLTGPDWDEEIVGTPRDDIGRPMKRKTRTQRNKARRLAVAVQEKLRRKQRSKIISDADKIDSLLEEIAAEKAATEAKQAKKRKSRAARPTLKIGRRRFEPTVLDLQLPEDMSGSLRTQGKVLPSMQQPLKNRFESFQQRSLVPALGKQRRKPKRPTRYFLVSKHTSS